MRPVSELDLRLLGVVVSRNGEMIDTEAGAAALGNPARCVAWLANKLGSLGAGRKAGDVILPGAVHKMVPVNPGDVFRAEFAHLGPVTVRFSKEQVNPVAITAQEIADTLITSERERKEYRPVQRRAPRHPGRDGLRGAEALHPVQARRR